ncbi:MAG: N-acetyltransferase [Candidatus Sulfotelmatobacter sp.]
MAYTVRDFQTDDFDALWRIDQSCFPAGISYSRAELRFYMRRPAAFTLVAIQSNQESGEPIIRKPKVAAPSDIDIAGFIVAECASRGRGHIITIDVVTPARRFGVGSLLLEAAEIHLRAEHCHIVELETAVDNVSALSFYKRHGYSVTKTFPRYYSNGVDALVLEKNLI